jgi:hypothetical protein
LGFWEKPGWIELKSYFNSLLISLSSYAEYLVQKNKRMNIDHQSLTPVRQVSENIHLKFLASASQLSPSSSLKLIEEHLCQLQLYEVYRMTDLLPSDRVQRHRVVNSLITTGLSFPCIMLVYAPGSNIGNFHFLWKVPSNADVTECFEQSQSSIEQAKEHIPTYHSRATRAVMFKKFGMVSSGVYCYFFKDLTGKCTCV